MTDKLMFDRLLALVNLGLKNSKTIDEKLFELIDEQIWANLYQFSIRHGVMAIAFDGVSLLPTHLQPPLKTRLSWAISTEQVEKKYVYIKDIAKDLSNMFKKEGVDMLVFKGIGLSNCYPNPLHREFGDIDIYLFGQSKKGDLLLEKAGATKKVIPSYKHSNYYYKNILIENHYYFLDIYDSPKISHFNKILGKIVKQEKLEQGVHNNDILFPSANFTALFLMAHAIKHLSNEPLSLRSYCDWFMFLKAYANEIDINEWKKNLRDVGLLNLAEAFTSLTYKWFDVTSEIRPILPVDKDPDREIQLTEEMWQPIDKKFESTSTLKILAYKVKHYNNIYKRHILFYNKNFYMAYPAYILTTIRNQVKNPKKTFKIR